MNPVFTKELRSMLRERRGWLVPMVYAAGLAAAALLIVVPQAVVPAALRPRVVGASIVSMVAVLQALALLVFAPLVGAAAVAGERERSTWLSLLASPVPRRQIATGKILASMLYVLVLLSVSVPLAALGMALGSIDLRTVLGLYTTHALIGGGLACLGVAASTVFGRTWTAALVAIALVLAGATFTALLASAAAVVDQQLAQGAWHDAWSWIWYFNPAYGLVLFFSGDTLSASPADWWGHLGAQALLGALAAAYATLAVGRMRG